MLWRTLYSCVFTLFLITSSFSNELILKIQDIQELSWDVRNLESQKSTPARHREILELDAKWQKESFEFALWLEEQGSVLQFSEEYIQMDPMARNDMQHVVQRIKGLEWHRRIEGLEPRFEPFAKYFPGWGYAQPGKIYKLGREVKREFLHAFWEKEERLEKTVEHKEFMVDIKVLAKLKAAIPELVVGAKMEVEIGGNVHFVYKVSFHKEVTIKTTQQIKKGVERVWFELHEADKPWPWQDPKWEKVGQTYQHHTNPTGEQVIVDVDVSSLQV